MSARSQPDVYFIGGHDLEMREIARVLAAHHQRVVDHRLSWAQAHAATYNREVRAAIAAGLRPVLVELRDIPDDLRPNIDVIDHHGPSSGAMPSSLDQVLARLCLTPTRNQQLISANDRGYIDGMLAIGASSEDVARIRRADREAQGITSDEECAADAAVRHREHPSPSLTIVRLPHGRTATVTDRLSVGAGGPGYRSLLIESPSEISFFGPGAIILTLSDQFGGYCGGMLPERGFWGVEVQDAVLKRQIELFARDLAEAKAVSIAR